MIGTWLLERGRHRASIRHGWRAQPVAASRTERPSVATIYRNAILSPILTRCRDARMMMRSAPANARRSVIADCPRDQMLVRPQSLQLDARWDRDDGTGGGASDPSGAADRTEVAAGDGGRSRPHAPPLHRLGRQVLTARHNPPRVAICRSSGDLPPGDARPSKTIGITPTVFLKGNTHPAAAFPAVVPPREPKRTRRGIRWRSGHVVRRAPQRTCAASPGPSPSGANGGASAELGARRPLGHRR
jgi:hypothetical protein